VGRPRPLRTLRSRHPKAGHVVALIDLDSQPTSANWGDRRAADTPAVVSAQVARLKSVLSARCEVGVDLAILDTPPRSQREGSDVSQANASI